MNDEMLLTKIRQLEEKMERYILKINNLEFQSKAQLDAFTTDRTLRNSEAARNRDFQKSIQDHFEMIELQQAQNKEQN